MLRTPVALFASSFCLFGSTPTFHKDISPILQRHCQGCHRPGEIGPMPLLTYSQVRPFAAAIKEAAKLKRMPPWGADPSHGKFANDPSLTATEIETLTKWAELRAPEGDAKDAPSPIAFVEGWNIGVPEQVFSMPKPHTIPAKGTIDYTYFVVPSGFTEDRWVTEAEVRPANRSVVHHVIIYVREPGSQWLKEAIPGEAYVPTKAAQLVRLVGQGEYLVGFTPGKAAMRLEPGQGKLIKAGSDLIFQVHYTANGKEAIDQTRVGVKYAKAAPVERVLTYPVANRNFSIPPGAADYPVTSEVTFLSDARVVTYWPHMHVRGKTFRFEGKDVSGKSTVLLNVPRYDFNWQHRYVPREPLPVTTGSKLECFATFDNSANNVANPDPKATVQWGDQSWEEMMIGFIEIAFDAKKLPKDIIQRSPAPGVVSSTANE